MTRLFLHGIGSAELPVPAEAPRHSRVTVGVLSAIVSPAPPATSPDDQPPVDLVVAHHEILSHHALIGDLLPVRFGTVFSGEAALAAMLDRDRDALAGRLAALAGCVEFTLVHSIRTATGRPAQRSTCTEDGRTFLQRKRVARDGQRSLARRRVEHLNGLPDLLSPIIESHRILDPRGAGTVGSIAVMVRRPAIPDMTAVLRIHSKQAERFGLDCTLRGPGPCYSFADNVDVAADVGEVARRA